MSHRYLPIVAAAAFLTAANLHAAADASFLGKWKINIAKSTTTGFQAKIVDAGHNRLDFTFGDDVDSFTFDGKEHPSKYGGIRICTQAGPKEWDCATKREGKITSTQKMIVSDNGKTLDIKSEGVRADGTAYKQDNNYKRVAGKAGLTGTWESTKVDPDSYPNWVIEPFGADGLAFITPAYKQSSKVKFDGKDYPDKGPRVAPGATTAGKRIDAHTIELTDKRKGKLVETDRLKLSADGKTLTLTATYPAVDKKEVDVYERQ